MKQTHTLHLITTCGTTNINVFLAQSIITQREVSYINQFVCLIKV